MTNLTHTVSNLDELKLLAQTLLKTYSSERIFTFIGDLGSGKTTFIKDIIRELGCTESVSSPTYSIVNEYVTSDQPIYHIDLYRLKDIEEALHIGIEEYLYSGHYCFIEWPQIIDPILPEGIVEISIEYTGDTGRKMLFLNK